jgi:hypothetical protein
MGRYFQLFVKKIPYDLLVRILNVFELEGLEDNKEFTKEELLKNNVVKRMYLEIIPDLILYYIDCKAQRYLNNLTIKKCLTILKQVLRLFNYSVAKKEIIINKKKYVKFSLQNLDFRKFNVSNDIHTLIL